MRCATDGKEV